MHFWRNFSEKILETGRLVFAFSANRRVETDHAGHEGAPDGKDKGKRREEVKGESAGERKGLKEKIEEKIEEIDESGEAKDYLETFQKQPQFDAVNHMLSTGMEVEGNETAFNFENWLVMDSKLVANVFDLSLMPRGKGRWSFVDGLRIEDHESEEFKKSQEVLNQLVGMLRKRTQERQNIKEDTQKEHDKPAVGETIGDGVKTLMRNFKRASGTEKVMILGAIGIGISLLWKYKDKAIFKDFTFGDAFKWAGALWGINYLSGKVSKDGKTLVQRMDVGLDIEQLKDSRMKGYAYEKGMDKDQEKYRAFLELQTKDVRQLYQLYKEASGPGTKKEIDPKRLGIYNEAVDGKAVYEIMEELVKDTSVNLHIEQRRKDAEAKGIPYNEQADRNDKGLIASWTHSSEAQEKFESKYFDLLQGSNVTLIDAILNEYQTRDFQTAIAAGRERRRFVRAAKTTADVLEKGWGHTKHYAGVGAAFVYKYGGKAINFTNNKILKPVGGWIASQWNRYSPHIKEPLRDGLSWMQEGDLNKVLPLEFNVDVLKPGQAKIMGLAGIPFEIKTGKDSSGANREVAEIDGIKFVIDDGVPGNKTNADALKKKIEQKVGGLIAAKKIPEFAGITPRYDGAQKKWFMDNVPVAADAFGITPGGKIPIEMKIDDDGTTLNFFDGDKEISNLSDLTTEHMHAALQEEIWKAVPGLEPIVEGLPVKIDGVVGSNIMQYFKVNLGGLDFAVTRKAGTPPTYEYVETSGVKHPLKDLKIEKTNGGLDFLKALGNKIFQSDDYKENYLLLEAEMENTKEGFTARMKELAKTKMWILPTNLDGAINGQILQEQWRYTLQFKMFETLQIFKSECKNEPLDNIPTIYNDVILKANQHLKDLLDTIRGYSDKQKADEFQNFLSGKERTITTASGAPRNLPAGLEYVNYPNPDYRDYFEKYQALIQNPRYNYEGFDNYDVAGKSAHEIYLTLLLVWSYHTKKFRDKPGTLVQAEKDKLQFVIDKVQDKLEKAKMAGGVTGTVKMANLPAQGKTDDTDLKEWLK
ncbi:hypothetical protein HYW83_04170 [Candidatus Peregrinibacteria bacterium]|nr:hypothetical protein [Candidatus Peregrinibacteria bacterium]